MGFSLDDLNPVKIGRNIINEGERAVGPRGAATTWFTGGLNHLMPRPVQAPPQSQPDPRLVKLQRQMQSEANRFKKDLPGLQQEQRGLLQRSAEDTQEQGIKDIRYVANRRGLLYSGYREGAESDLKSRVASSLASNIAGSNKELANVADKKKAVAAQVGLSSYQDSVRQAEDAYNAVYANSVLRSQSIQRLGEGVGYAFGAYAAKEPRDPNVGLSVDNISYRPGLLGDPNYGSFYQPGLLGAETNLYGGL